MKPLKDFLAGVPLSYFEEDFFDYGLWYSGAEYSIRIEKYDGTNVNVSLRHYGVDIRQDRHIFPKYREFVAKFDEISMPIFANREIPFAKKPLALWNALTEAFLTETEKEEQR